MANRLKLSLSLAGVFTLLGFLATTPGAWAESTTGTDPNSAPVADTNTGFSNSDSSGGLFGQSGSPFDLIHRAVLMNNMTLSDFSRQQQSRMSTEAANFRVLQQEAIRQQANSQAAESPEPVTP